MLRAVGTKSVLLVLLNFLFGISRVQMSAEDSVCWLILGVLTDTQCAD